MKHKWLSNNNISTIYKLRKDGKSLGEICRILKANKTTIYYHLRKKFGRSYTVIKMDLSNDDNLGEILGAFAADGGCTPQSDYQIVFYFSLDEPQYVYSFSKLLENVFGKKPWIYRYSKRGVYLVRYKSKDIYKLIKEFLTWNEKKSHNVKLKTLRHNRNFLIGYLRGYLDCDGFCPKNQQKLLFVTSSKRMALQLKTMVKILGFTPFFRVHKDPRINRVPHYRIEVRAEDAVNFIKLIKPRNQKRIRSWAK